MPNIKTVDYEIQYIHRVKLSLTVNNDISNTIKRLVYLERLKVILYMKDEDFMYNNKTVKELLDFFNN